MNPLLAACAAALAPGAALDVGCGAGGDTLWLAERGWRVTSVDVSVTAVERVVAGAASLGLSSQVTAERHDLSRSFPAGRFDLVSAQYFHTSVATPRDRILRAAAEAVVPGGRLLVVDHGSIAPWSWNQDPATRFPAPAEIAIALGLHPDQWSIERADTPRRQASGPGGQTAEVIDHVLLARRRLG